MFKTEWDLEKEFGYELGSKKIEDDCDLYAESIEDFCNKWDKSFIKNRVENILNNFSEYLDELDILNKDIYPLLTYLHLKSSVDIANQPLQKTSAEIYKNFEDLSEKFLFIDEVWKKIGYDKLIELSKVHTNYTNYLTGIADSIKYILSPKEERVILKMNGGNDLYDEYLSSITLYSGGEKTLEEVWGERTSADRSIRISAFKTLSNFYNQDCNNVIFKNIYSDVCKSNITSNEIRGVDTGVMTSRNLSEEMDSKVVDKLIEIVGSNYSLFHKYLKKKKDFLGFSDFSVYDILAPLGDAGEKLTYEDGCKIYLDTIRKVDESIYQHGLKMLDGKTDVYPRKGKRGGAFCSYDKFTDQFVLLNWKDKLDDLTTLAHEFGHAFHGMLSHKQNNTNYSSPLVLCETASIFNETILFNESLNMASDESKKILIFNRLDDLFSTIFRQIMYIRFERICHSSWERNEPLTSDDYNSIWLSEYKLLVGDSIVWDKNTEDLVKWGWMAIPHIYHTPFYCYAYSFGNLLSLNVYEEYVKSSDKKEFMKKYFSLLEAGGSKKPKDILKEIFDFDITSDDFYLSGLNYIESLINKL